MEPPFQSFVSSFLRNQGLNDLCWTLENLHGDGSMRTYWRVRTGQPSVSFVLMANPPLEDPLARENEAFFHIGRHLRGKGLPLPRIYARDPEAGLFLLEDMGSLSLEEAVGEGIMEPTTLYEQVLEQLLNLQVRGAEGFDPQWCHQTTHYDQTVMLQYESGYFQRAFVEGYLGWKGPFPGLERAFYWLARRAAMAEPCFFLHRDFQSRNLMVQGERIGILDWQGGRLGPLGYDLASLLMDPYTALCPETCKSLYAFYRTLVQEWNPLWAETLDETYPFLALQRNLQILGAFSFLSRVRNKPRFETYIPTALNSLDHLLCALRDPNLTVFYDLVHRIRAQLPWSPDNTKRLNGNPCSGKTRISKSELRTPDEMEKEISQGGKTEYRILK